MDLAVYKLSKTKGSNHVTEAGFCCLRRRPEETLQGQRQQTRLESKILLPPLKTRRMVPRSKAAINPRNQDFAASAEDPMNLARSKGSKHAQKSRFCCLRRRPRETRQDQKQHSRLRSRILLLPPVIPRNPPGSKAAITPQEQDFAASAEDPVKLARTKSSKHTHKSRF